MNLRLTPTTTDHDPTGAAVFRQLLRIACDGDVPTPRGIEERAGGVTVHVRAFQHLAAWRIVLDAPYAVLTGTLIADVAEQGFATKLADVGVWVAYQELALKPCVTCGSSITRVRCGDCSPLVVSR